MTPPELRLLGDRELAHPPNRCVTRRGAPSFKTSGATRPVETEEAPGRRRQPLRQRAPLGTPAPDNDAGVASPPPSVSDLCCATADLPPNTPRCPLLGLRITRRPSDSPPGGKGSPIRQVVCEVVREGVADRAAEVLRGTRDSEVKRRARRLTANATWRADPDRQHVRCVISVSLCIRPMRTPFPFQLPMDQVSCLTAIQPSIHLSEKERWTQQACNSRASDKRRVTRRKDCQSRLPKASGTARRSRHRVWLWDFT